MTARNLGRGLNALLGEGESEEQSQNVKMVMLSDLEPSPFQPRRVFDEEGADGLQKGSGLQRIRRSTDFGRARCGD